MLCLSRHPRPTLLQTPCFETLEQGGPQREQGLASRWHQFHIPCHLQGLLEGSGGAGCHLGETGVLKLQVWSQEWESEGGCCPPIGSICVRLLHRSSRCPASSAWRLTGDSGSMVVPRAWQGALPTGEPAPALPRTSPRESYGPSLLASRCPNCGAEEGGDEVSDPLQLMH